MNSSSCYRYDIHSGYRNQYENDLGKGSVEHGHQSLLNTYPSKVMQNNFAKSA